MNLGPLYHWTRKVNRESILRDGLKIMEPCSDGIPASFPWICLGTTPSAAWSLFPLAMDDLTEEEFDLWEVEVREGDRLHIRGDFAPEIIEVRVLHGLPADRLWWVAERMLHPHDSID